MMVSKIAVVALVAVIAVPILLGYALNLTETTETDYRASGEAVNVTPLLQNGSGYNYAHADVYQINTEFYTGSYVTLEDNQRTIPQYTRYTAERTSYPLIGTKYVNQSWNGATQGLSAEYFYEQFDYDPAANQHNAVVYETVGGVDAPVKSISYVQSVYFEKSTGYLQYSYYYNGGIKTLDYTNTNITKMVLTTISGKTDVFVTNYRADRFADLSKGFNFYNTEMASWYVKLPEKTKSVLYTIDLDSITDANYRIEISRPVSLIFEKTTVGGVVKWTLKEWNGYGIQTVSDLYYDPSRSDNTYQVYAEIEDKGISGSRRYYDIHSETRYVGSWPTVIGEANYYLKYDFDYQYDVASNTEFTIDYLWIHSVAGDTPPSYSPRLRMDDAYFRAFTYSTINDNTYTPATFRENPATTIENPTKYGSSITFGGNTYTVSKEGKITLNGHDIPVKDLVFSSVPNENGTYDNRIGKTFISTSATPSTIRFNGSWAASISTQSMEQYTYTKTEWHVGEFGWDGVDQNFLIVGLITCLGVFVALGIYARKRGTGGIIPLMIVTGCAAAVFFIML